MKHVITLVLLTSYLFCYAQNTIINFGDSWNYYDAASEPIDQGGLNWTQINYNDVTWQTGNTHLGYGDGDETTIINNSTLTAYCRRTFNVNDPSIYSDLDLDLIYDDGAVVYLNGTEIWRVNMPSGTIDYHTFALTGSGDNATTSLNLSNSLIVGDNILSVEIHQTSASSSDISFDFQMKANIVGQVNLIRGPYLQSGSDHSTIIKWRTNSATESIVNYGTSLGNLTNQVSDLALKTEHEIEITGLNPETIYYYTLSNNTGVILQESNEVYFKTSPTPGTVKPYKFWVLGDCGTANSNQRAVRDAYYNYIGSDHTDGILFLGDNAYNSGTDSEYQLAVFENMYESKLKNSMAWSCLGNHDGYSADSDTQTGPYYNIFTFPKNGEAGGMPSGTEAYYSFDYGNIHFLCLDSYDTNRSVGSPMYNWALSDIQNTTQEWIVAYWHHPPYTKGSHDSDTESNLIDMRQNFLPMLEINGVDLILSGHSHSYERSYLLNGHYGNSNSFDSNIHTVGTTGNGDGQQNSNGAYYKETSGPLAGEGAVYITTGSSGKKSAGSLDHEAMYYSVSELGSCIIEVNGNQLDVKFLRETDVVEDFFTITKAPQCTLGDPCDDGDPCTLNDIYVANCGCSGTQDTDTDNDGYCDVIDQCPGFDDALIGTSCDDNNANTINDVYTINCLCEGIICPILGTPCDDGDPNTINDIEDGACNCFGTPTSVSNCVQISTGDDDAEENGNNNSMYLHSSDIELVYDSYQTAGNQTIGLRFLNLNIPPGAQITEAKIQFTADEVDTEITSLSIFSEDSDNSLGFINSSGNITSRTLSTDSVLWSPTPWNTVGESGPNQLTPDISQIIQSVVNRNGYLQNNPITIIIKGTGRRTSESFNGSAADAAELCITFLPCSPAGTPCDDNDPCTINDVYNNNCGCSGTASGDSDNDGICDVVDQCPGQDDALIGTPCDDNDPCTINDVYDNNCGCSGTPSGDSDNDGICDAVDQCPGQDDALIGTPCDDNDPCTINDVYNNNCGCSGTASGDSDNDGICDAVDQCPGQDDALIGTPCDDNDPCTINDIYDNNCGCSGTSSGDSDNDGICNALDQCPGQDDTLIGTPCDDNDPCTINDVYDSNCGCNGTLDQDSDNDGICDALDQCPGQDDALIGTPCDDNDPCTINDVYDSNCGCSGTPSGDSDNDGICDALDQCPGQDDALIGTSCDDNDPCTINDVYDSNCGCNGTLDQDSDNDGICDALDQCPGQDDALIGTACDDNDPCTINDVYDNNCGCSGTSSGDSDNDGICDALDQCPGQDDALIGTACDDNDPCTINDVYDNNCGCIGTSSGDSDNDGICDALDQCPGQDDALIGTSCDDNDPCTINDVYDSNCGCSGTTSGDSDNDGICDALDQCPGQDDALIGTACDDNNPCTINDVYDNNCGCSGTPSGDSDNDSICDALDQCPGQDDALIGTACDDNDPCTINDVYDSNCGCSGLLDQDSDNDGFCDAVDQCPGQDDALIGTPCDDNDPCTINDVYNSNCGCSGTPSGDSDNDGICDALDQCPGQDDALIGTPCDDNDTCTLNDVYGSNCGCSGTPSGDSDNDGICDAVDSDPNDPCIPDASNCDPCIELMTDNFESGFGNWIGGGGDCTIRAEYPNSGNYSIRLRDNSGTASSMYTTNLDLSIYDEVIIDFSYFPNSMENNEDFMLEISLDGGNNYSVIESWIRGTDFENNIRYNESVSINNIGFTNNTRFRLRCDASGNGDRIFIDDVIIQVCAINCTMGDPCDDNDNCTINDLYDANCNCSGILQDDDNDGVCNADDLCPGMDDNLIGQSCDDNDSCTTNDIYDNSCNCVGIYTDNDGDGYCIGNDPDDFDGCIPDPNSPACAPCAVLQDDDFENGLGNWNDGGNDCARSTEVAQSGLYSIKIRDNSGVSSSMYTDNLDLSPYNSIDFEFSYYAISMESNEDFFLEISTDGGVNYNIIQTWVRGIHFNNNSWYQEIISIDNISFTSETRFRLRCDASGNNDKIFIDDVIINPCVPQQNIRSKAPQSVNFRVKNEDVGNVNLYPNPASNKLNIINSSEWLNVALISTNGKVVINETYQNNNHIAIDLINLDPGLYFVQMKNNLGDTFIDKIIIVK